MNAPTAAAAAAAGVAKILKKTSPSSSSAASSALKKSLLPLPLKQKVLMNPPLTLPLPALEPLRFNSGPSLLIGSWNLAGYNSAMRKGKMLYVELENPDILLLQETKLSLPVKIQPSERYPYCYSSESTRRKGYSGVATLSNKEPLAVEYPIFNNQELDGEGRFITLEFQDFFLLNSYLPFAGMALERLDLKILSLNFLSKYLKSLSYSKPVIFGGDLNVALQDLDLGGDPRRFDGAAGCTTLERKAFHSLLEECDLIDSFREFYPNKSAFSYFNYRENSFKKRHGWRIDYFLASRKLFDSGRVKDCIIRQEIYGASDHVPLVLQLTAP